MSLIMKSSRRSPQVISRVTEQEPKLAYLWLCNCFSCNADVFADCAALTAAFAAVFAATALVALLLLLPLLLLL